MAVYFITNVKAGAVKIGVGADPQKRLTALQIGCPDRLALLGSIPGGREREKSLHKAFRQFRLRGEWFRAAPTLLAEIRRLVSSAESAATRELFRLVDICGAEAFSNRHYPAHDPLIKTLILKVYLEGGGPAMRRVYDAVTDYCCLAFPGREGGMMAGCLEWRFDGVGGWFA
jgi:hypothetical protein